MGASSSEAESGLTALAALLSVHGVAVDPSRLRHEVGHFDPVDSDEIVRLARGVQGVRAKRRTADWSTLARLPLPVMANGPGGWFLIGRSVGEEILIQRAGQPVIKVSAAELGQIWSGELILVTTRESPALALTKFGFSWFVPQIVRYRRLIGEVLLITFALNVLGLAAPLFFQAVVDKVLVHETLSTLNVLVIGFVAVSVWETIFGWLRTRLYSETSQKIDVELGARLFRHLLRLPLGYFEARRVGDTTTRVRQLESIREFLTNASLSILVDPLFTIVFLVVMAIYSIKLFLISVCAIPAYIAVAIFVTGPMRTRLAEKFERGSANTALLVESIGGIQTIKASAVEPLWQDRWEKQLAAYSSSNQRVIDLGNTGSQAIQLISKLNMAAILFFGAQAVIAHDLTVGGLVAFNMFAQRVSSPVIRMAQLWQEFQQVRVAVQRLGDVLDHRVEPGTGSQTALPAIRGDVRFENIQFRYGAEGAWTLDELNLTIAAGSSLGVVGSSGSGKSTLAKLLQRFYRPARGRVLIDGHDIEQIDPAWLRRQIGVVLQENVLFNRSIRDNIAISDPTAPIERVIAAAQMAGAHEFVTRLPLGYDTMIEERGANLSGGQRQRIAIARALVRNPRILIFDEATSALDVESEEIVQNNLRAMIAGRTVMIIAHRLSTVRHCDRIITIENGRIMEAGTHDELLRAGGRYADLHRRQQGAGAAA